jgi:hypothetical protein
LRQRISIQEEVGDLPEQSASSRAAKYILINAMILLVADTILITVNLFVELPRLSALLAPLCLTAISVFLLFIAFLELRK